MPSRPIPLFPESLVERLADQLWGRMVGSHCDPIDLNLRAKLALEYRLSGDAKPPFGLDKLGTEETGDYIGLKPETLRDKNKRRILGIPPPYSYGRKLFWRRSELDAWLELQRVPALEREGKTADARDQRAGAVPRSHGQPGDRASEDRRTPRPSGQRSRAEDLTESKPSAVSRRTLLAVAEQATADPALTQQRHERLRGSVQEAGTTFRSFAHERAAGVHPRSDEEHRARGDAGTGTMTPAATRMERGARHGQVRP